MAPGGLAQLARAPALQAGGRRFDSDILHESFYACERPVTRAGADPLPGPPGGARRDGAVPVI
jgi:hypothetical protein